MAPGEPAHTTSDADPATDEQLLEAARHGDSAAFTCIYHRYAAAVRGTLLARMPCQDVPDAVQEVFLSAWRKLVQVRKADAIGGWLLAIARNTARQYFRRRADVRRVPEETAAPSPAALELLSALQRLPPAYRETMMLRFVEGMTGPEIAPTVARSGGSASGREGAVGYRQPVLPRRFAAVHGVARQRGLRGWRSDTGAGRAVDRGAQERRVDAANASATRRRRRPAANPRPIADSPATSGRRDACRNRCGRHRHDRPLVAGARTEIRQETAARHSTMRCRPVQDPSRRTVARAGQLAPQASRNQRANSGPLPDSSCLKYTNRSAQPAVLSRMVRAQRAMSSDV